MFIQIIQANTGYTGIYRLYKQIQDILAYTVYTSKYRIYVHISSAPTFSPFPRRRLLRDGCQELSSTALSMPLSGFSRSAVNKYVPEGVQRADFTEPLDGCQRLIFFFRSLYDAIKELLKNSRFNGRQYTQAEVKFHPNGLRAYNTVNL